MITVEVSADPAEDVAQPAALLGVEAGGRLVEDEQVGAPEQRLGQRRRGAAGRRRER